MSFQKLGGVPIAYLDDHVSVYIGDAFAMLGALSLHPFKRKHGRIHVITDPPYDEHTHTKMVHGDGAGSAAGSQKSLFFAHLKGGQMEQLARAFAKIATGWVLIFCADSHVHEWRHACVSEGMHWRRRCLWCKSNPMPKIQGDGPAQGDESFVALWNNRPPSVWNGGGRHNMWTGPKEHSPIHPTQKPLWLMESIIENFTDKGDLIIDPFGGSFSTAVAAKKLGRQVLIFEYTPKMARMGIARLRGQREQTTLFGEDVLLHGAEGAPKEASGVILPPEAPVAPVRMRQQTITEIIPPKRPRKLAV